jgi:transposase
LAAKRLKMSRLKEILRLSLGRGLSQRKVARALRVGNGTVSEYLGRARAAGVGWPLTEELEDEGRLEAAVLGQAKAPEPGTREKPDVKWIHGELRRVGVTLSLLWQEYLAANPGGYQYSQFCEYYRRHRRTLTPTMRQVHRAGEKAFVDFSGKRPSVVDPGTGEIRAVELFVGVLGASSYVYAEAAERQDLTNWIDLNVGMLESFGGVPAILVPDNLKSGVTGPCRYEADVNRTYEEMATHYGAAVIPARAYKPRDKAKVEVSVLLAQRWVLAALRNRTFFSLADLNAAIRERVEVINGKVMRRMGMSRRDLFEKYDRPALRSLPAVRYELSAWKTCTVNIDYHIELDHNLYSVPSALVGQKVEARATRRCVEIYLRQSRVASHRRQEGRGRVSTVAEHMPVSHRSHAEWTPSRLIAWGQKAGPATGHVVETILRSRPHPEQGYRACLGLMRLGRNLGNERLEAACERARRVGGESYRTVKNILASGMDRQALPGLGADPVLPPHENIRGAASYAQTEEAPC